MAPKEVKLYFQLIGRPIDTIMLICNLLIKPCVIEHFVRYYVKCGFRTRIGNLHETTMDVEVGQALIIKPACQYYEDKNRCESFGFSHTILFTP